MRVEAVVLLPPRQAYQDPIAFGDVKRHSLLDLEKFAPDSLFQLAERVAAKAAKAMTGVCTWRWSYRTKVLARRWDWQGSALVLQRHVLTILHCLQRAVGERHFNSASALRLGGRGLG